MTKDAQNFDIWKKMAKFVFRYAPSGSTVRIYNLYPADGKPRKVAEVKKHPDALF